MSAGASNLVRYDFMMPNPGGIAIGPYQAKYGPWIEYETYKVLRRAAFDYVEQQDETSKRLLLEEINREATG